MRSIVLGVLSIFALAVTDCFSDPTLGDRIKFGINYGTRLVGERVKKIGEDVRDIVVKPAPVTYNVAPHLFRSGGNSQSFQTFNLRGPNITDKGDNQYINRRDKIIHQIETYKPSVVGFQEINTISTDSLLVFQEDQYSHLKRKLEQRDYGLVKDESSYRAEPKVLGKKVPFLETAGSQYNSIAYRKDQLVVKRLGTFWLNEEVQKAVEWRDRENLCMGRIYSKGYR